VNEHCLCHSCRFARGWLHRRPKELTAAPSHWGSPIRQKVPGGGGSSASKIKPTPRPLVTRIRELAHKVTDRAIARVAITKEWVLRELLDNAEHAKSNGSWAARNRSLELVGKEIGMFGDQEPPKPPRPGPDRLRTRAYPYPRRN
jgi:hypothetical protein